MKTNLPAMFEPFKLVEQHRLLEGLLPARGFLRLQEACYLKQPIATDVAVKLQGYRDEQNCACIRVEFQVQLPVICQRCMQTMNLSLKSESVLSPVTSEKAIERLPSDYEPLMVTEDLVSIAELAEDELLLAMPTVPLHDLAECQIKEDHWLYGEATPKEVSAHPLAGLADLLRKKK